MNFKLCLVGKLENLSQKLEENNQISQPESKYFACTRTLIRHIDRLGPWRQESEAKVHTSFRPSEGPRKNLRGRGGANLASLTTTITENLDFFLLYDTGHPTQD